MQIFTQDEWKYLSEKLIDAGNELDRRFPGITLKETEFHVRVLSGNLGQIGNILKFLDISFRWSLSIANEMTQTQGDTEEHRWALGTLHPFPMPLGGGGLRVTATGVGSFWTKAKVANDAIVQAIALPSAIITMFCALTGVHPLNPAHDSPGPLQGCERVVSKLADDELLKAFREAGPGGYTVRTTCKQPDGSSFYMEWAMERKAPTDDLAHVHNVQLLRSRPTTMGQ